MPTGHAERLLPALRRAVLARESAARSDAQLLAAFVRSQDADAFAVLVRRHGPMVLGVCRRVVGDHAAADDAFQAVFLVLARRAASVRPRGQVGNWLYGVAYRTAIKARAVLARRRSREKQVEAMPEPPAATHTDVWSDLKPVIDEELARLPDKLRVPVVLCDLEGRPQRAVARDLGIPPATLATRVAAARRLLAQRLTRRGVTLSGGALAVLLGERAAANVLTPRLADGAVRAAEAVVLGAPVHSLVSAHAVHLSEGVMRMMMLAKLKVAAATALTLVAVCGGFGVGLAPAAAQETGRPGDREKGRDQPAVSPSPRLVSPSQQDDATYLNRLCLDLRGTPATPLEQTYFAADTDPEKRRKVVEWCLTDDIARQYVAKKLGIHPDRIRHVGLKDSVIVVEVRPAPRVSSVAFSPDGQRLAVAIDRMIVTTGDGGVTGSIILNERNFDAANAPARLNLNRALVVDDSTVTPGGTYKIVVTADPPVVLWDTVTGKKLTDGEILWSWLAAQPPGAKQPQPIRLKAQIALTETDEAFLRRVMQDARGAAPSAIELKYFTEDKDPNKREKLLDALLKDPAVQKKLGDDWKKRMLQPTTTTAVLNEVYEYQVVPRIEWQRRDAIVLPDTAQEWFVQPYITTSAAPDRLTKLMDELLGAKKTDEQVLEALTLAVVGRLPTDGEKRLTLGAVSKASDRKAAWLEAAKALAGSDEAKKYGESLAPRPTTPKK